MLTSIALEQFKCFQKLDLELAPLTLLTGYNAAGKSSTLQALLLLSQTFTSESSKSELQLNGRLVNLGSPGDVLNRAQSGGSLVLGVADESFDLRWRFELDKSSNNRWLSFDEKQPGNSNDAAISELVQTVSSLVYISALRHPDWDAYPTPQSAQPPWADVGLLGQYAAWWLHQCSDDTCNALRRHRENGVGESIRSQLLAWMGELFPGAEVNAVPIPKTRLVRLEFRLGQTDDWNQPCNVGYGLTYALPILVAGLIAKKGQVLIIDSPEAHLHPRAQSAMGRFLAQMAASGVQVLVETHSEHVANGLRLAVRDKVLDAGKAAVYFFGDKVGGSTEDGIQRLHVDANGALSTYPKGFFDQSEQDLAHIAGWY